ncbi:MAG TPA: hypothetical protein VF849_01480 [Blattabacteriaceae bacterium]
MRKIICDICGNEYKEVLEEITGQINLHRKNGEILSIGIVEIKLNCRFDTTNIDICRSCLINGIKAATLE